VTEIIYLDTCALNRPTDNLSQPRVRAEAQAVARLLDLVVSGKLILLGSHALQFEVSRNTNMLRRLAALELLSFATASAPDNGQVHRLARELTGLGFSAMDAIHLALAQTAGAQVLLTTDDRLILRAARSPEIVLIEVANPVDWLQRRFPWLLPRPS
jgi:predicted nucleic acid-binding protein